MNYEEYKKIIDSTPETEGLEYNLAVLWLHPNKLPLALISLDGCTEKIVRVPAMTVNSFDNTVSVIGIGKDAFKGNTYVTDIILGHNIEKIGAGAFADCTNLKRITIPQKIKQIPQGTFEGCISLSDIYYEGSLEDWKKIEKFTEKREVELGRLIPGSPVQEVINERIIHNMGNEALILATLHLNCILP